MVKKIKSDLSGSQFRMLNELLYTNTSHKALSKFKADPSLFKQYHAGFESQSQQWPTNPVNECRKFLVSFKNLKTIADFGCGTAKIAKSFENSPDRKVYSFDLVDGGDPLITPCNIASVPLPDGTLDCVLFNLSLMGVDWPKFIQEAFRCLKKNGVIYIAEVTSRIKSIDLFKAGLTQAGFDLKSDFSSKGNFFHTFIGKKRDAYAPAEMNSELLAPCIYKKR
jgi:ribosomal RNA-processing protein 8